MSNCLWGPKRTKHFRHDVNMIR